MMLAAEEKNVDALVVDDHPFVRETASFLLRRLGVGNIAIAGNGREARELLVSAPGSADLILCDLNMPEEDGLVFLRWLADQGIQAAIILMSGVDSMVLSAAKKLGESRNLNIVGVVEKPLSANILKRILEKVRLPHTDAPARRKGLTMTPAEIGEGLEAGHFEVWFQPQIQTISGRLHGFEALLRMRHPVHGVVGPDSFIGPAEQSGHIGDLTELVIEQSVKRCAAWQDADHAPSVSINLSAKVLNDLAYPDRLAELCARCRVDPEKIVLELTESALAGDGDILLDIMVRMRLKKFRLSIDDFGTGFSSLEQLKGLPFHELKVDKSFVLDAVDDARSRSILESSLGLASSLNLTTVAEGVETQAHLKLIAELGCDLAQGFLISKPMPADSVAAWLAGYRP